MALLRAAGAFSGRAAHPSHGLRILHRRLGWTPGVACLVSEKRHARGTHRSDEIREANGAPMPVPNARRRVTDSPLVGDSVSGKLVYRRRCRSAPESAVCGAHDPSLLPLNTVCPYYTMFPIDFPLGRLAEARSGDWVLDPFCGRGTTIFAARLKGLGSVGIDSNPVAAAIAAAKLTDSAPEAIIRRAESVLAGAGDPAAVPQGAFWGMCFHRETLRDVCRLREHFLHSCTAEEDVALRALMLGILHGPKRKTVPTYVSNQMPRTYATKPDAAVRFWNRRRLEQPPAVEVLDAIARRARFTFTRRPPSSSGDVHLGDARAAHRLLSPKRRFSWVITSPPYFGMRTYRPDQWLRNWFLGGEPTVDYSQQGQLAHHSGRFVDELAAVWRSVARRCREGAHLIVRFGYLPSTPMDAQEMLRTSLAKADAGWRITRWADAGSSTSGRRQSRQFRRYAEKAASEIDAFARLEA